jgi:peptidoglycan hydrolase-like protein with peptidoglycan-binding domain
LQPPPPQGIATFDDLIPKASETISTQPPPSQSSATTPIAHRKSVITDPVVRAVQQRLNKLDYNAGTVDGIMGKRTRTAIESFQRDHALAVDGVASKQLLERLNNAQARTQNTQTLDQSVRNQDRHSPDWITASTETKPYQADPPVIARQCYVRPVTAPNGQPWPASASYVAGFERLHTDGLSIVTVDNSRNDSNVFVKLFSLDGAQAYPVRVFFIPAYSSFTLNKIQAGNYDIRYCDLSTGGLSKSEPFYLKEIEAYGGIQYSNITMTLYKVAHGNMQIYDISEADF